MWNIIINGVCFEKSFKRISAAKEYAKRQNNGHLRGVYFLSSKRYRMQTSASLYNDSLSCVEIRDGDTLVGIQYL